jgi:SecD/SecF fusion protein
MKKRKAIITLIVFFALLAGMVYTAIYGLGASKSGSASDIKLGLDLAGGVSITYQVEGDKKPSATDMSDTIYKLQKRVDNYSTEAHVYQEGDNRIDIEIPGVTDANAVLEEMGKPGSLYFIRQTDADGNQNYVQNGGKYVLNNKTIDQLVKSGDAVLTGSDVSNAEAGYQNDSMNNQQIVVDLTFTASGAKKFADATTKAYKAGESIGIYYDGEFISVPRVQAAITDGKAVITGESTIDEAKNLASTIRIGGLKLELKELRSNVVGAQLGQNAIKSSLKAAVIGFAVLVVFMIAVYYLMGSCCKPCACYVYGSHSHTDKRV